MAEQNESKATASNKPHRAQDFFEIYANNVNFESSVWDLKLILAVLDQDPNSPPFKQLGSVHVPWMQAKIMAYYLLMNIVFHEASNGPIDVVRSVAPPNIEDFLNTTYPGDEKAKAMGERVNRLRAELGL